MAEVRLGSCSLCGGDVMGWQGGWYAVVPPPPPHCTRCGAKTRDDVIQMVPPKIRQPTQEELLKELGDFGRPITLEDVLEGEEQCRNGDWIELKKLKEELDNGDTQRKCS